MIFVIWNKNINKSWYVIRYHSPFPFFNVIFWYVIFTFLSTMICDMISNFVFLGADMKWFLIRYLMWFCRPLVEECLHRIKTHQRLYWLHLRNEKIWNFVHFASETSSTPPCQVGEEYKQRAVWKVCWVRPPRKRVQEIQMIHPNQACVPRLTLPSSIVLRVPGSRPR